LPMMPPQENPSLFPVADHVFPIVAEDVEAQREFPTKELG